VGAGAELCTASKAAKAAGRLLATVARACALRAARTRRSSSRLPRLTASAMGDHPSRLLWWGVGQGL
jgi:hypothetical protein